MAPAVKGDPQVDQDLRDAVDRLHALFWKYWRQVDYDTALHVFSTIMNILPKLFQISHTRGKQGHGKR